MDDDKVKLHVQFVQNLNGTDVTEVLWATLPSHMCTFFVIFIGMLFENMAHTCKIDCIPNMCNVIKERRVLIFVKEFIIIVLPLILLTTNMSDITSCTIFVVVTIITMSLIFLTKSKFFTSSFFSRDLKQILNTPICDTRRSFVTCCRSIVNMMTVISILGVDFCIFPRRYAKTETFGFSLMDVGVGFFVFSNAAVTKAEKIVRGGVKNTILSCFVLFLLGLSRYFSLQEINYQRNVTEYGTHWNFFFTLGIIKLLSFIILKIFNQSFVPAIFLSFTHQFLLYLGLQEYVVGDRGRENWIDANREGLVSILGYTSLYLIGISTNKFVLEKSTSVARDLKTIVKLVFTSAVLFIVTLYFNSFFPVSRRLVSLTYISWVTSLALLHVSVAMIVELTFILIITPMEGNTFYNFLTPILFESINYNGLIFFILANLHTGLVNIFFDTLKIKTTESFLILAIYMGLNCGIICFLYYRKIQLKFW